MSASDLILALGWAALCVFLVLFVSKRVAVSLENAEEKKPGVVGNIIYYTCKWITIIWLLFLGFNVLVSWPPHWLERIQQRRVVLERVQNAGGWRILKQDCNRLLQSNATNGYYWHYRMSTDNPPLPKSLEALKPHQVDIYYEKDGMCAVRINIFGGHATGGRGIDFYTLKIVCPLPVNVRLPFRIDENAKVRYGNRRIFDGVYEETHKG